MRGCVLTAGQWHACTGTSHVPQASTERGYCTASGWTPSTLSGAEGVLDVCALHRQREVSANERCVMVGSCSTAVALVHSSNIRETSCTQLCVLDSTSEEQNRKRDKTRSYFWFYCG